MKYITKLIEILLIIFIRIGFVYWAWSIVAPHLNAPIFSFWQVLVIYLAIRMILGKGVKIDYEK